MSDDDNAEYPFYVNQKGEPEVFDGMYIPSSSSSSNKNNNTIFSEDPRVTRVIQIKLNPTINPKLLGGGNVSALLKGGLDFVFRGLPRPSIEEMPLLHSDDSGFWDESSKATFYKIYQGDFTLQISADRYLDSNSDVAYIIYNLNALLDDVQYHSWTLTLYQGCLSSSSNPVNLQYFNSDEGMAFQKTLKYGQKEALSWRIQHLLLRSLGAYLETDLFNYIYNDLHENYVHYRWWKEELDLSVIKADVTLAREGKGVALIRCLVELGESLRASKRYFLASNLYKNLAFINWHDRIPLATARLWAGAAKAMQDSGKNDLAEPLYLRAMHIATSSEIVQDQEEYPELVGIVVEFYLRWVVLKPEDWTDVSYLAAFFSLLVVTNPQHAKFEEQDLGKGRGNILVYVGFREDISAEDNARNILLPRYCNDKSSKETILTAFSEFSHHQIVALFRSGITKCSVRKTIPRGEISRRLVDDPEAMRQKVKSDLESSIKATSRKGIEFKTCTWPS